MRKIKNKILKNIGEIKANNLSYMTGKITINLWFHVYDNIAYDLDEKIFTNLKTTIRDNIENNIKI
jgi:hypothetical protein